jgi:hypothetical protein
MEALRLIIGRRRYSCCLLWTVAKYIRQGAGLIHKEGQKANRVEQLPRRVGPLNTSKVKIGHHTRGVSVYTISHQSIVHPR